MKKLISIILPCLLICTIVLYDHMFPYRDLTLVGVYILFPIIFVVQGVICSKSKKSMFLGFMLSSISIILLFEVWYNVGSMLIPVIIYVLLGLIAFLIKRIINKKILKSSKK